MTPSRVGGMGTWSDAEGDPLTADALLKARRRVVPSSLGGNIVVRALSYSELASVSGLLLDVSTLAVDKGDANAVRGMVGTPEGQRLFTALERVVRMATVVPKFVENAADGPVVSDLPFDEQLAVFSAALELAGYTKEAAKAVLP